MGAKLGDGVVEVDGVSEDDGGDREVEAGGTVALVFEGAVPGVRFGADSTMTPPLTVRAYRHVIPNGTYHFPRAIEGGDLLEYATVCFRNDEDFGPGAQLSTTQRSSSTDTVSAPAAPTPVGTSWKSWFTSSRSRGSSCSRVSGDAISRTPQLFFT